MFLKILTSILVPIQLSSSLTKFIPYHHQRVSRANLSKAIIKKIGHSSFAPSEFEHNEQLVHELKAAVTLVSRLPSEVSSDTKIGTVQHNLIQYVDLDTS